MIYTLIIFTFRVQSTKRPRRFLRGSSHLFNNFFLISCNTAAFNDRIIAITCVVETVTRRVFRLRIGSRCRCRSLYRSRCLGRCRRSGSRLSGCRRGVRSGRRAAARRARVTVTTGRGRTRSRFALIYRRYRGRRCWRRRIFRFCGSFRGGFGGSTRFCRFGL